MREEEVTALPLKNRNMEQLLNPGPLKSIFRPNLKKAYVTAQTFRLGRIPGNPESGIQNENLTLIWKNKLAPYFFLKFHR